MGNGSSNFYNHACEELEMSAPDSNQITLKKLLVFTVIMFGFGFALIPFYKKICEVVGLNNLLLPDVVKQDMEIDKSRLLTVELDANTRGLPWTFRALQKSIQIHPGEMAYVMYEVRNNSDREIAAQAIPSYAPQLTAQYLKKIECFCFTKQVLQPNEVKQMPVQFVIEPGFPADITIVTLSYTFFEIAKGENQLSEVTGKVRRI